MPLALILSSHVAGSQVGATAQAAALAQFKIDTMVVPTVLFGRHPGWGIPGGAPVPIEVFEGMLDGIEANGLFGLVDLVITGYFATAAQARASARVIDAVREAPRQGAATRKPVVVVDPTMGDAGKGLYIAAETADEIIADLIPRADVVACNAWELQKLTGMDTRDPVSAMRAARLLGKTTLVSSVYRGTEIGAVLERHLVAIGLMEGQKLDEEQRLYLAEKRAAYEASQGITTAEPGEGFPPGAQLCGKCNTQAVVQMDGCATCLNCGYSKCG